MSVVMNEGGKLYFQGRVVASTYDEAVNTIIEHLKQKGYVPVRGVRPYHAPIQPWNGLTWWEYVCEVEEVRPVVDCD